MERALADLPVTVGQAKFLRHIVAERDGVTPARLAELAGCSRPNATQPLARLQRAGLVAREETPSDGRSVRIRATDRGRQVLAEAIDALGRFERTLRERLGDPQARALWELLEDVLP